MSRGIATSTADLRSAEHRAVAGRAPRDLFLQIHVASACNLACRHCYRDGTSSTMSLELFSTALEQFADLAHGLCVGRCWVQITGGEPLLHPRIWEMLDLATARFDVRLLSNGTLIDARAAARLRETCTAVQVSLDGLEETHDHWRGGGAFRAAMGGLRRLGEAGVTRSVRMTVGGDNVAEVMPLVDSLEGECEAFSASRVVTGGGCAVEPPATAAYRKVVYGLYGRRHGAPAIRLGDPFFGPLIATDDPETRYRGCSAGHGGLCVVEDGTVYPCRRLPLAVGAIATQTLTEIYDSAPLLVALRRREFGDPCGGCEDAGLCGGGRCLAFAATGDPLAGDPGCIHMFD